MNLSDLTSKELRIIGAAIAKQIEDTQAQIDAAYKYIPHPLVIEVTAKDKTSLAVLREFHVQVLTSLQAVRELENIHSN